MGLRRVTYEAGETRSGVLVFSRDGTVDGYASIDEARRSVEAIDVGDGEYDFFRVDGFVIEATVFGRSAQEFSLRVSDSQRYEDMQVRLRSTLPLVGLDESLADDPIVAVQRLIEQRWSLRWPRWPLWLDRRLHGDSPHRC